MRPILLAALLLAGCATAGEQADAAWDRGDWDAAAAHYEDALSGGEPGDRARARERLGEAKARAGEAHAGRSRLLEAAGDLAGAHREAEAAFRFAPDDALAARLRDLRERQAAALRESGRAAFEAGQWERAADLLGRAEGMSPSGEGQALLLEARRRAGAVRAANFAALADQGDAALARRDWAGAVGYYEEALRHGRNPDTERRRGFAQAMQRAEAAVARGDEDGAEAAFEEAAGLGIDGEFVRARMAAALPREYVITLRAAAILPFRPEGHGPWDGGDGSPVPGTARIRAALAAAGTEEGGIFRAMGKVTRGLAESGLEPPDAKVRVLLAGKRMESGVAPDDYTPAFDLPIRLRATAADARILSVELIDADGAAEEGMGSVPLPIADLVAHPGAREFVFIDPDGRLHAGALLALRLTVEAR